MTPTLDSQPPASAAAITHDPARLAALCEIWKAEHKQVWLTLMGYSMAPTLLPGTRLCVECGGEPATICLGDILAVRREGRIVIHRLAQITGEEQPSYICKGDGNAHRDDPVEGSAILGRVVKTRRPSLITLWRQRLGRLRVRYRRWSGNRVQRGISS